MKRNFLLITLIVVVGICSLYAQAFSPLPVIPRLDSRDVVFRQYLADVEAARRLFFSAGENPGDPAVVERAAASLTIYSYVTQGEDLLSIAARCNVPYGTLSTLNRLSRREDMISGKSLLLSSIPGIFIPEKPETDMERLLSSARVGAGDSSLVLSIPIDGRTEKFRFFPGDDLAPTERIFFLNREFRFPLRNFQVTSTYGPRINPITGKAGVHRGLDLAAPLGTEVFAVKDGTVIDQGEDPVLGKYIIISHANNWISLYGHLSVINTVLRSALRSGNLIGRVGSTGQSTGPHLHFELRQDGQSRDPARLLGTFKENTGL